MSLADFVQTVARPFGTMAALQFVSYLVLTVNFRAISHEQYLMAGGTAALAAINSYIIVRRIVKNEQGWGLAGLIVGGAVADMFGIWITRHWS